MVSRSLRITLDMKCVHPHAALSMVSSCCSKVLVLRAVKLELRMRWRSSLSEAFKSSGCFCRSLVNCDKLNQTVWEWKWQETRDECQGFCKTCLRHWLGTFCPTWNVLIQEMILPACPFLLTYHLVFITLKMSSVISVNMWTSKCVKSAIQI